MTRLEKLYNIIDNAQELGIELGDDVARQVEELEEQIIKGEILPALSHDIEPRLNPIKRNLVLVVEYSPDEPIRVALSRKVKIKDFADAKVFTPESRTELSPVQELKASNDPIVRKPTEGIRVAFPDGTVICRRTAISTFIATIHRIGFERVAGLRILHAGINIVSRIRRSTENGHICQQKVGEWYIFSNTNNRQKMRDLRNISDRLGLYLQISKATPALDVDEPF